MLLLFVCREEVESNLAKLETCRTAIIRPNVSVGFDQRNKCCHLYEEKQLNPIYLAKLEPCRTVILPPMVGILWSLSLS